MKNNSIFKVIKEPLSKNIGLFILVSVALLMETGISLFIPNILSLVICVYVIFLLYCDHEKCNRNMQYVFKRKTGLVLM